MYRGILAGGAVVVTPPLQDYGTGGTFSRKRFRELCKEWDEVEAAARRLEAKAQRTTGKRRTVLNAAAQAAHEAADEACIDEDARLKEAAKLLGLIADALRAKSLSETVKTANAAKNYALKVAEEMEEEEDVVSVFVRLH